MLDQNNGVPTTVCRRWVAHREELEGAGMA